MLRTISLLVLLAFPLAAADLPNILWISIEDTGQEVEPYDLYAHTPAIAGLAREGVTFLNAFSHSPVCAPTRSGIITGVYPSAMGTQHMRSSMVPPAPIRAFPEYLRAAGYYATNNSKEDYNFPAPFTAWDESSREAHWKNRPDADQPFFAVFNLTTSHEGPIRQQFAAREADPSTGIHDAVKLLLPPYYPDTPKVREAWASYYDVVTITDRRVGELLAELDEAGLRDKTLVLFWGDHGAGLARAKRWLYDSGVKVPLIARWPGVIEPGTERFDMVQFLDLAPTMLAVADVERPDYFHGRVVLGPETEPEPERLFHARDRMDERYDMHRAVRDRRYKYIRHFEAHKPWVQFMRTPSQGKIYEELGRLKQDGGLDHLTSLFMRERKPYEELYDTLVDPYEMHNLAEDPSYRDQLVAMREQLEQWMVETDDKGLVPEPELYRTMFPTGEREQTDPPEVSQSDGRVTIEADGASIGYSIDGGPWLLYSKPVELPAGARLEAKAVRLGYDESEPVTTSR